MASPIELTVAFLLLSWGTYIAENCHTLTPKQVYFDTIIKIEEIKDESKKMSLIIAAATDVTRKRIKLRKKGVYPCTYAEEEFEKWFSKRGSEFFKWKYR